MVINLGEQSLKDLKNTRSETQQDLTESQIQRLYEDAEPLCDGDTSDLLDWIREGNRGADITHSTARDIANEWNELTKQANG